MGKQEMPIKVEVAVQKQGALKPLHTGKKTQQGKKSVQEYKYESHAVLHRRTKQGSGWKIFGA